MKQGFFVLRKMQRLRMYFADNAKIVFCKICKQVLFALRLNQNIGFAKNAINGKVNCKK